MARLEIRQLTVKKFNNHHVNSLPDLESCYERFDPVVSINSGQVFLWEKRGDVWYGIYGERIIRFSVTNGKVDFAVFPEDGSCEQNVFRLDDKITEIFTEISRDAFVRKLVKIYPGLRLMRQEPHQCLFSFLCASNTNIPMIRRMLRALTRKFGKRVKVDGVEFFTFPSPSEIKGKSINDLRACGVGYRAKAIRAAADAVVSGRLDFDALKKASYEDARKELLGIYGVGPKIADCVLLFSLEKLDAFPIDLWIGRVLRNHYGWLQDKESREKVTEHQYYELSGVARRYFGRYAGYAQQYLYYHARQAAGKSW